MNKNPYPNEHAARLVDPKYFTRFARNNNKFGGGVHAIWGIAGGRTELQAIRFDSHKFNVNQAREWLHNHGYTPILFEPAIKVKRNATMRKENPDWDKLLPKFMTDTKELLVELIHSKKRSQVHPVNRKAIAIDRRQKKDRMTKPFKMNPHIHTKPEIARHIEEIIDNVDWSNMLFALVQQMGLHKGLDHFIKEHPSFRPFRSALVTNLDAMGYGYKRNPTKKDPSPFASYSAMKKWVEGHGLFIGKTSRPEAGVIYTASGHRIAIYNNRNGRLYLVADPKRGNPGDAWHKRQAAIEFKKANKNLDRGAKEEAVFHAEKGAAQSESVIVSRRGINPKVGFR